jgi:nucleotide-binding universal stress UspA family protein
MKRLLVIAYDGSDRSKAAVRHAAELSPGSAALVVTVWEPGLAAMLPPGAAPDTLGGMSLPDPEVVSEVDHAMQDHASTLAQEGARLAASAGLEAEHHAVPDEVRVAETIVDLAVDRKAAAVVVGSHGISGLRSRLMGSVTREVLKRCPCPVLVVREDRPEGS